MSNPILEFYRCPAEVVELRLLDEDDFVLKRFDGQGTATAGFPSDLSRIVDNLRLERYHTPSTTPTSALLTSQAARSAYYRIRPALSNPLRQTVQRFFFRGWDRLPFPQWPVDTSVEEVMEKHLMTTMKISGLESVPFIWFWPDGAPCAATMTHDVEAPAGLSFVPRLIDVDDEFGIKTSFQLVPEQRYALPSKLLETIRKQQCEVNVHGLNHDGNLFRDRNTFLRQCKQINQYVREFGAEGFRSSCMYRNVEWYEDLDISYDMSVPNVAHLEPQRGGCCTVFPYFIGEILELPLTTTQDYSLFHILGDHSIGLWKRQIELIMLKHGLISFITHPDYLLNETSLSVYENLLAYLLELRSQHGIWIARPGDINRWWRQRNAMRIALEDGMCRIEGSGRERARLAFACIENRRIVYKVEQSFESPVTQKLERACLLAGGKD